MDGIKTGWAAVPSAGRGVMPSIGIRKTEVRRRSPWRSRHQRAAERAPAGDATAITAGEAVRATMGRCLTATPTPSSPTSIRPSARRSRSRPARCASWPARGVARPGSSRDGSPTRSPPTWSGRATCWSSRSPTRPPARCVRRLAALGHPGVAASTFHAAALRQLRHFWPRVHGSDPPSILESKVPILAPLAAGPPRRLPVPRRSATSPARSSGRRRAGSRPTEYEMRAIADDRDASLPPDLMAGLYRRYEAAKARAGRIDFEDMLELTIGLIEADATIAAEVRDRYRWFSVDEYQDTNPLQAALLDAWLGGREDLAVVGDEDQTIYTFTGATSDYLIGFAERYPTRPGRAARDQLPLDARGPRAGQPGPRRRPGWRPTSDCPESRRGRRNASSRASPPGPEPEIGGFATDEAELAGMTDAIRALGRAGTAHGAMAILVRTNAQLPAIEAALGAAGIPFHVRGERFFARPEVRRAMRVAGTLGARRERGTAGGQAVGRVRARARRAPRHGPRGRGRRRTPWRGRHAARTRRGPGQDGSGGGRAGVPRRGRAADRGRGRRDGDRRRAADLPPGQGPRVGRGLPARARGGHAADPPVDRARRAGRGATPALRRDHPGAALPVAVVGHHADRRRPDAEAGAAARGSSTGWCRRRPAALAVAECRTGPGRLGSGPRRSTRPTGRRSRMRSVPGARPVPAPTPSPRSSSSTTRPSRPSRHAARARSRSCAGSPASARRSSTATARRSSASSSTTSRT